MTGASDVNVVSKFQLSPRRNKRAKAVDPDIATQEDVLGSDEGCISSYPDIFPN